MFLHSENLFLTYQELGGLILNMKGSDMSKQCLYLSGQCLNPSKLGSDMRKLVHFLGCKLCSYLVGCPCEKCLNSRTCCFCFRNMGLILRKKNLSSNPIVLESNHAVFKTVKDVSGFSFDKTTFLDLSTACLNSSTRCSILNHLYSDISVQSLYSNLSMYF